MTGIHSQLVKTMSTISRSGTSPARNPSVTAPAVIVFSIQLYLSQRTSQPATGDAARRTSSDTTRRRSPASQPRPDLGDNGPAYGSSTWTPPVQPEIGTHVSRRRTGRGAGRAGHPTPALNRAHGPRCRPAAG